jgi:hypothetical protein
MSDTLYITNKTNGPLHAVISDKITGSNVITCELQPGPNEIAITALNSGVYMFCLSDDNDGVFYQQKIIRD